FVSLLRHLDDTEADPRVRITQDRSLTIGGAAEEFVLESTLSTAITTTVTVVIAADLAPMESVKSGEKTQPVSITLADDSASWGSGTVSVSLSAPNATLTIIGQTLEVRWEVTIPAKGRVSVGLALDATDTAAVVS